MCLDASQDLDKQLTVQPPGQEIVLSPSSEVDDDNVVERHGPPVVEAMYSVSCGVSCCAMNKGEKSKRLLQGCPS